MTELDAWWPATELCVSAEFVAGIISTFPPHNRQHPEECLPIAKAVMLAIAEEQAAHPQCPECESRDTELDTWESVGTHKVFDCSCGARFP